MTDGNPMMAAVLAKSHEGTCGAKTRAGTPCQHPSGWGTDHVGQGRCKLHGGNAGRPIVHGRYSLKHRQSLAEKAQQFEEFEGSVAAELALLRVLLQEFLGRFQEGVPLSAQDIYTMRDLADSIGRMEQRSAKIRKDTAFGAQEMQLFIAAMSSVLQKYVSDDDLPDAIGELRSILARS